MVKVKAAVLSDVRKLETVMFDKPTVKGDSTLIKVDTAGVCGTDVHIYEGRMKVPLPVILGHEFSGEIVEIGEEAGRMETRGLGLTEGDHVTVVPGTARFCGKCYYCLFVPARPSLCQNRKSLGITVSCKDPPHLFGAWSEYVYVDAAHFYVFKLPEGFPKEFGALIEPMAVASRALERAFLPGMPFGGEGFGLGKTVVVQGAGPIGLLAISVAKSAGAGRIIAVDSVEIRLKMAERMGADNTVDMKQFNRAEDRVSEVKRLTYGVGADVVIECTGVPNAVPEGLEMARDGGKYVEVGHYTDTGPVELRPHRICRKDIDLLGSWAYPPTQFGTAIAILDRQKDRFPFKELITHQYNIDRAKEAIDAIKRGEVVKAAIVP